MIHIIPLYFTENFQSEYEPVHLLLGISIGIIGIVIIVMKIINKKNNS